MTTTETAKMIRSELKAAHPTVKFSVRKIHFGTLNIEYDVTSDRHIDWSIREIALSFTGWNKFNTDFVFVNCYGRN